MEGSKNPVILAQIYATLHVPGARWKRHCRSLGLGKYIVWVYVYRVALIAGGERFQSAGHRSSTGYLWKQLWKRGDCSVDIRGFYKTWGQRNLMKNRGNFRGQKDPGLRCVGWSGEDRIVKEGDDLWAWCLVQLTGPLFSIAECSASVMNVQKQCNALKQNMCLESSCTKVTYTGLCWNYFQLIRRQQKMHWKLLY